MFIYSWFLFLFKKLFYYNDTYPCKKITTLPVDILGEISNHFKNSHQWFLLCLLDKRFGVLSCTKEYQAKAHLLFDRHDIDEDDTHRWYRNNKLHRDDDLPAVIENKNYSHAYFVGQTFELNGIVQFAVTHRDTKKQCWYYKGQLHRKNAAAIIYSDGSKYWYRFGKLHQDNDDPAILHSSGAQLWYYYGRLDRGTDKPCIVDHDGNQYWYYNNKLHRENDRPAVIFNNGDTYWYCNGKLHRDNDRPAEKLASGIKRWYYHGKKHRENDQPAVIYPDGRRFWYYYNEFIYKRE